MRDAAEETVELPTDASPADERPAGDPPVADSRGVEPPAGDLPAAGSRGVEPPASGRRTRSGFWAELSGALALGLAVLAGVVLVFQILAWAQGMPGPGALTVVGHLVAAGLALLAQRFADRRRGWQGAVAVLAVVAVSATALWLFWWA